MKIVVLDFTDGKLKVINNAPKECDVEDYEIFLYYEYDFSISNIEYMVVPELQIEAFG